VATLDFGQNYSERNDSSIADSIRATRIIRSGRDFRQRDTVSTVDDLILDLLEWLERAPRPYSEVLDAWRTSCPRLPVWEEANDRGFIGRETVPGRGPFVAITPPGIEFLTMNHRGTRTSTATE
jgi:hypothetical protein